MYQNVTKAGSGNRDLVIVLALCLQKIPDNTKVPCDVHS